MAARKRTPVRVFQWLLATALTGAVAAVLAAAAGYMYLAPRLPAAEELREVQLQQPLRVYDRHGRLMAVYGSKRRLPLAIDEIPKQLRNAFIAAEDDRFYQHPGVDWMGITRAALNLIMTGEKGQGGSTITMQVARNFFLSREKTYIRKIKEILLALKIERRLDKDAILELYLNKIYLGKSAYGVGAAAQAYYGRSVDELTLAQMATIAGLPTAPSRLNPVANPDDARSRRRYVLARMYELGMIDTEAFDQARTAAITATPHDAAVAVDAPYIGEMARIEAVERFGEQVYTSGYRVYTTVDGEKQRAAIRALRGALVDYETRHGYTGPLVRLDPRRIPEPDALRRALEEGRDDDGADATGADGVLGPEALDEALSPHDAPGDIEPAVVVGVGDDHARVYRDGGLAQLPWAGMEWAAPRNDEGEVGAAPEAPDEVVARGHLVHIAPAEDGQGWRLAQVPDVEGALVALDPANGAIRALRGGYDFGRSKFNRVTQARRQPGSNFKPFIYSAALNDGFTPATLVNDAPVVFDDPALEDTWRPENYSGRVFGPTRLREGLVYSRNLVSIRILIDMGISYAIDYIQRFGFPEPQLPKDLTLALGSAALTPLQIARGYSVFANRGFEVDPFLVTRIQDGGGDVVYRANPAYVCREPCEARARSGADEPVNDEGASEGEPLSSGGQPDKLRDVGVPDRQREREQRLAERVVEERNAYIVRSFLRDVARRGTGRGTRALGRDDIGGKTGTTDDQLDAWFSGFNSSLVATAWVGYDQMQSLGKDETGARAALPMWLEFMRTALADTPERWPDLPEGMVTVRIDGETGDYAGPNADNPVFEIFREENAPQPPEQGGRTDRNGGSGDNGDSEPLF